MNVLLVRPKAANMLGYLNVVDSEPLELEYLYTALRDSGYNGRIYDALLDKQTLSGVFRDYSPDVICITGYITQRDLMLKYAAIAKRFNPAMRVIVGGVYVELNVDEFRDRSIDYIIHTSCLKTFTKVLKLIAGKEERRATQVKGICFQDGDGDWVQTARVVADINDLPIPDRSYFNATADRYKYLNFKPCASLKTSYSCPFKCNFCYCRNLNAAQHSVRDIHRVVDEIETIQCENIYIVDDNFLVDVKRLETFIRLLESRNIRKRFLVYGRADFVAEHGPLMTRLKQVGVSLVMVGLESNIDTALEGMNKQSSRMKNERCIAVLRDCGIDCMGFLIVDHTMTKEGFQALSRWIDEVGMVYLSVAIFTPLPGTEAYDVYKDRMIDHKIQNFDFLHCMLQPENMSLSSFYRELRKLYFQIFRIAKHRKIYDFLDVNYYMKVFDNYFRTLIKE